MKKYTALFEDILKVFASLSILLIICGYIDIKTYYNYFGINISRYISSSEIIMASLDNLLIVFLLILIQLIIWLSFFNYLFDYTQEDINKYWGNKRRPVIDDHSIRRLFQSKRMKIFTLVILLLVVLSTLAKSFFLYNVLLAQFSLFIGITFFIFFFLYLGFFTLTKHLWDRIKDQKSYNPKLFISFLIFFPILAITVWVKNDFFVAKNVYRYGNKENIELLLENDLVVGANDSIRYLGRTDNYFFYWNKKNGDSKIYPLSQVKEIHNYYSK